MSRKEILKRKLIQNIKDQLDKYYGHKTDNNNLMSIMTMDENPSSNSLRLQDVLVW